MSKNKRSGIIRVSKNKNNPYVMMNKTGLNDTRLSFKAKGILAYLLSKPDNWKVVVQDLVNNSADGRDSVYSGLNELKETGYLEKYPVRDQKGKIMYWESMLYEIPIEVAGDEKPTSGKSVNGEKPLPGFPDMENPDMENPDMENPERNNNDYNNNDYSNNNNNKADPWETNNDTEEAKDNVVVVNDEDVKKLKAKIEEVTKNQVIDDNLVNYLKRPNGKKELAVAIKNYPAISKNILQTKDIPNPVGLLFYIAKNNIQPPNSLKTTGLSKKDSFGDFEQHEYDENELEHLFLNIG